jgi:hypothetical protein
MSIRVDSSPLIAGAVVVGDPGHGVLGSQVPSAGEAGPGYMYDVLDLPDDNDKEVRGLITRFPTEGTLYAYEDSSFVYDGATDSFEFQLYVDGVPRGDEVTVYLVVGGGASVEPTVAQSVSIAYDPLVSATPSVATVNPTAALSISIAHDPAIETQAGDVVIHPTAARSFSVAYDPMVKGGVNITIPTAASVSQAYDPVVRIGFPRSVRRIIRQGQYITRLSFQGRI